MVNILIVEDKSTDLDRCVGLVKELSHKIKIHTATSGREAFTVIKERDIDAALIDIEMPDMDGFELAYQIRKTVKTHFLPIVFITATDNNSTETYLTYHNYSYIQKPYSKVEFIKVIEPLFTVIKENKSEKISERRFLINTNRGQFNIGVEDILYIETIRRVVNIITIEEQYEVKGENLEQLVKRINDVRFLQCHRKCFVNIEKIRIIQRIAPKISEIYFTSDGCIKCPVGYTYRQRLQKVMLNFNTKKCGESEDDE